MLLTTCHIFSGVSPVPSRARRTPFIARPPPQNFTCRTPFVELFSLFLLDHVVVFLRKYFRKWHSNKGVGTFHPSRSKLVGIRPSLFLLNFSKPKFLEAAVMTNFLSQFQEYFRYRHSNKGVGAFHSLLSKFLNSSASFPKSESQSCPTTSKAA